MGLGPGGTAPVGREEFGLRDFGSGRTLLWSLVWGGGAHEDAVRGWVWTWGAAVRDDFLSFFRMRWRRGKQGGY